MDNIEQPTTPQAGGSNSSNSLNIQFSKLATKSHSDSAMASDSQQTIVENMGTPSDSALFKEFLEFKAMKAGFDSNANRKRVRENSGGNTSGTASKKGRPNIPPQHLQDYRTARNSAANEAKFTVLDVYLRKYLDDDEHLVPRAYQVNNYHPNILFTAPLHNSVSFLDQSFTSMPDLEPASDEDMD